MRGRRIGFGGMMLAVALACAPAAAQGGCASLPAGMDSALVSALAADGTRAPDVVIRATVSAREVRFASEPRATVRTPGCLPLDTVIVTERVNLPDPVQPGVTYRDVRVGIEIRAHLDVRCLPALAADPALAAACGAPPNTSADPAAAPRAPVPPTPPRR
jgi:hypothetical protein